MAEITKYEFYEIDATKDNILSNIDGIVSFLGSYGLRKVGEFENVYKMERVPILTFSNNPNIGLCFGIDVTSDSSKGTFKASLAYKRADGSWWYDTGLQYNKSYIIYRDKYYIYLASRSINGITLYGTGTMPTNTFTYNNNYARMIWANCRFANVTFVDYFTSEQRRGMLYAGSNSGNIYAHVYNDKTHSVDIASGDSSNTLDIVPLGGTRYPKKCKYVASPIMFASNSFYGYIKSPSACYRVLNPNGYPTYAVDTQIKVGGSTFMQLYNHEIWVRI